MPEFTPEQRSVIEHEDGNLLVSAAAGSGKTAVLVERIMRLVEKGADVDSFLVVTFTRAAADELRQRLQLRLEESAETDERMREQLERLSLASISTIHAFCLQLLTRYFEKVGVEPKMRMAGEIEQQILQSRAMDDALDALYLQKGMLEQLEEMGTLRQVRLNVESLYRFLMCQTDPDGWLENAEKNYAAEAQHPEESAWFLREREYIFRQRTEIVRRAEFALRFAQKAQAEDCRRAAPQIAADIASMGEAAADGQAEFARWKSTNPRGVPDSPELKQLRALRDDYKDLWKKVPAADGTVSRWEKQRMQAGVQPLHVLCIAVRAFMAEYARLKKEADVADYNDLEQLTLRLTLDPGVCEDLRQQYRYIFVDEYQDSSRVQETILNRISRGDNVFHVGDVKQSIYGFRQSDPGLFLREQENYEEGKNGSVIALNRNFRSVGNVLECINRVFETCMNKEYAGMVYDEKARLYPGRAAGDAPDPATIVQIIEKKPQEDEEAEDVHSEVEAAARLIRRFIGTPIRDRDGNTRPASYGDIVILRRNISSVLPQYMDHFARVGIPVYAARSGSFYETTEIRQAMDYLWAIYNPREDVHLLGALHGVGGFSAQELAQIRLCGRREEPDRALRMIECLRLYAEKESGASGQKAKDFLTELERLRVLSREEKISVLCSAVLESTGMLSRFAAMPKGRTRAANLRSLPQRAAEYDAANLRLGDFLRRIAQTGAHNREEDVPAFSEKDDVVRIMSVHHSKGLEFPIVIGVGMGAPFRFENDRDADGFLSSRIWCDREDGLALEYYSAENSASDATLKTWALAHKRKIEGIAEEMRILYVLMTRARERLALVGEVKGLEKKINDWESRSPAVCPLDWIMGALTDHPDASGLREKYGIGSDLRADDSRWEISLRMAAEEEPEQKKDAVPEPETGKADATEIERMQWIYPYSEPQNVQKQTVTELVHGAQEVFFRRELPQFLQKEAAADAAQRGTAIHRFMEILDFEALKSAKEMNTALLSQVSMALEAEKITPEQAEIIRGELSCIELFLTSFIGKKILSGAEILREKPFQLRMGEGDGIYLVQGVIDLIVMDAEGAILVDYKTDRAGLDAQSVQLRHGQQVRLYRSAAELAGIKVRQSLVYLFATGAVVEIDK